MRYLALLMAGLMSLPALALTKVNLYQTEVVIDEQQDNADAAARIAGMQQVIVRATGDKESVNNEVIQKALRQNSQYLNQISYAQQGDAKTLRMGFSGQHIRSLLTQAQLPFWPENRANLLVWLVEESNYDRSITWEHANTPLLRQLKASAQLRGLPLIVPVGDFDDITGVQISDLWGGFAQPISLASQRYPTDAVLVVRAQGSNLRWTLYDQNAGNMIAAPKTPMSGQASGQNAAADMVDELSDYYAQKGAVMVNSESSEAVLASFTPVNGAVSFFTLEDRLKRLSSVASLDILKIQGNEVIFKVHLLASESQFQQEVLRMGRVVTREAPAPQLQREPSLMPAAETHAVGVDGVETDGVETDGVETDGVETNAIDSEGAAAVPAQADAASSTSAIDVQPVLATEPSVDVQLVMPTEPAINTLYFQWQG